MATRWKERRNGAVYATIRVDYNVPRDLCEWIMEQCDWNETRTMKWLTSERRMLPALSGGWSTLTFLPGVDKEPQIVSVEAARLEAHLGAAEYTGEMVV